MRYAGRKGGDGKNVGCGEVLRALYCFLFDFTVLLSQIKSGYKGIKVGLNGHVSLA